MSYLYLKLRWWIYNNGYISMMNYIIIDIVQDGFMDSVQILVVYDNYVCVQFNGGFNDFFFWIF